MPRTILNGKHPRASRNSGSRGAKPSPDHFGHEGRRPRKGPAFLAVGSQHSDGRSVGADNVNAESFYLAIAENRSAVGVLPALLLSALAWCVMLFF